jgi:hypothetical protein
MKTGKLRIRIAVVGTGSKGRRKFIVRGILTAIKNGMGAGTVTLPKFVERYYVFVAISVLYIWNSSRWPNGPSL